MRTTQSPDMVPGYLVTDLGPASEVTLGWSTDNRVDDSEYYEGKPR